MGKPALSGPAVKGQIPMSDMILLTQFLLILSPSNSSRGQNYFKLMETSQKSTIMLARRPLSHSAYVCHIVNIIYEHQESIHVPPANSPMLDGEVKNAVRKILTSQVDRPLPSNLALIV